MGLFIIAKITILGIFLLISIIISLFIYIKYIKNAKDKKKKLPIFLEFVFGCVIMVILVPFGESIGEYIDQKKAEQASVSQTDDGEPQNTDKPEPTTFGESEPNNDFSNADLIPCNNYISGNFKSSDDCDFYYFTTDEKISFQITLKHDYNDSDNDFCNVSVFSSDDLENELYEKQVGIKESEVTSPRIRVDKGTYYIKFDPGYSISENLNKYEFIVSTQNEADGFETEPNNSINEAKSNNSILLNKEITGNIQTNQDIDYYYFSVSNAGKLNISFSHDKIDEDNTLWKIELLSENSNEPLIKQDIKGTQALTQTDMIIPSYENGGKNYYLKIYTNYNYSDIDYKICVNYSAFPDSSEDDNGLYKYDREPNNSIDTATKIGLNENIEGNIQSTNDVDYYEFYVSGDGQLSIQFSHDFVDSDSNSWKVYVLSEISSENLLEFSVAQNESSFTSDTIRVPSGTYYLKIEPTYNYNNNPYNFKINFK